MKTIINDDHKTKIKNRTHPNLIFFGIVLIAIIINIDATSINLALPSIAKSFHASLTTLQWIVSIYILFGASLQFLTGKLSDLFDRKIIYLIGVVIFIFSSLACGISTNTLMLIISRGAQGIAFGFTLSLGIIIATKAYPDNRRTAILAYYTMIAGLSQAAGPLLSGIILEFSTWRWLFFLNIPLGILSFLLISQTLPKEKTYRKNNEKISVAENILFTIILFLTTIILNEINRWKTTPIFILLLVMFLCIILLFAHFKHSKSTENINVSLLRNLPYLSISIIRAFNTYIWFALIFLIPIYLQNIAGITALNTGIILITITAIYGLSAPFAGKMIRYFGQANMLIISLILSTASCLLLINIQMPIQWAIILTAFLLFGFSKAIILPSSVGIAMEKLPAEKIGSGIGLFYTISFFGGILGIALTGIIIKTITYHSVMKYIFRLEYTFSSNQINLIKHIATGSLPITSLNKLLPTHIAIQLADLIQKTFTQAASFAIWVMLILSLSSIILAFFLKKRATKVNA